MEGLSEVARKVAEVAQPGRAPDSSKFGEGEAEDRVVAGSNLALGTSMLFFLSPRHFTFFS